MAEAGGHPQIVAAILEERVRLRYEASFQGVDIPGSHLEFVLGAGWSGEPVLLALRHGSVHPALQGHAQMIWAWR